MIKLLVANWLEIFAVISSLAYICFAIERKIWLWILGALCSGAYVVVFFRSRLYADAILNIYYVAISVYGYFKWALDKKNYVSAKHEVYATRASRADWLRILCFILIVFMAVYIPVKFLPKFLGVSSASMPLIDSLLTSLSFAATWMLAKRYIEQWLLWIFINLAYMGVYWVKGLRLTIFLMFVYAIMSIVGYFKWKKFTR